jgi:hypothetical protein
MPSNVPEDRISNIFATVGTSHLICLARFPVQVTKYFIKCFTIWHNSTFWKYLSSGVQRSVVRWISANVSAKRISSVFLYFHAGFLLHILFIQIDRGNMFFGNISLLSTDCTVLYSIRLALTWPTGGGRSVGIVRLRIKGHGV